MNINLFNPKKFNKFTKIFFLIDKEEKTIHKTNLKYPHCHSNKLYEFEFYKHTKF